MADDIILTPEEQDERARRWLKENGLSLVVGIAIGLGAIYGYNVYKDNLRIAAEQASALYSEVTVLDEQSSISDISAKVSELKANYKQSPYAAKAALIYAKQLAVSDYDAAAKELEWVVNNSIEEGAKHTAQIRLAKIYLVQNKLDEAQAIASENTAPGFSSHYAELLGDIAVKRAEFEQAKIHYEKALESLNTADGGYRSILALKINQLPISSAPDALIETPEGE